MATAYWQGLKAGRRPAAPVVCASMSTEKTPTPTQGGCSRCVQSPLSWRSGAPQPVHCTSRTAARLCTLRVRWSPLVLANLKARTGRGRPAAAARPPVGSAARRECLVSGHDWLVVGRAGRLVEQWSPPRATVTRTDERGDARWTPSVWSPDPACLHARMHHTCTRVRGLPSAATAITRAIVDKPRPHGHYIERAANRIDGRSTYVDDN